MDANSSDDKPPRAPATGGERLDTTVPASEAVDRAHLTMIEKLKLNEAQREVEKARRLEARTEAADPRESIAQFTRAFEEERRRIEGAVREVVAAGPRGAGQEADAARAQLDSLAGDLSRLEFQFSQSTYFLPPYEQRSSTSALAALTQQIEEARAAVLPKKKFAFSRRGGTAGGGSPASASLSNLAAQPSVPSADRPAPDASPPTPPEVTFAPGMGLRGLRDQDIVMGPADLEGKDFTVTDTEGCTIYLLATFRALRLHRLRRCRVFLGPVRGSCFLEDLRDCEVHVASHQIRVHSTYDTFLCMRVKSRPIIEHCERVHVAPYGLAYPALPTHLRQCQLEKETGLWREVDDFGWIKAVRSPNWDELPEDEHRRHAVGPEAVAQAFPPQASAKPEETRGAAQVQGGAVLDDDDEI